MAIASAKQGEVMLMEGEAAERLNVSPRTMQGWRRRGVGPAYFVLVGAVRYRAADLEEFLGKNRKGQAQG